MSVSTIPWDRANANTRRRQEPGSNILEYLPDSSPRTSPISRAPSDQIVIATAIDRDTFDGAHTHAPTIHARTEKHQRRKGGCIGSVRAYMTRIPRSETTRACVNVVMQILSTAAMVWVLLTCFGPLRSVAESTQGILKVAQEGVLPDLTAAAHSVRNATAASERLAGASAALAERLLAETTQRNGRVSAVLDAAARATATVADIAQDTRELSRAASQPDSVDGAIAEIVTNGREASKGLASVMGELSREAPSVVADIEGIVRNASALARALSKLPSFKLEW